MERVKTPEDLQKLWASLVDPSYADPIKNAGDGRGFDPIAANATIFSRVEVESQLHTQAYYLRRFSWQTSAPAAGEAKARTEVLVFRAAPALGDITLPLGTVYEAVQQGTHGQEIVIGEFIQDAAVTVSDGSQGPISAAVSANLPGFWGNVPDGSIVRFKALGGASVPAGVITTSMLTRISPTNSADADVFLPTYVGRYVRVLGLPTLPSPRRVVGYGSGTITIDPPLPGSAVGASVQVEVEEWDELGLTVSQPSAAIGGVSGYLDAIARDRNTGRQPAEGDEALRSRLVNLADTISPGAIVRIAQQVLGSLPFRLLETRVIDQLKGFVYDFDPYDYGQIQAIASPGAVLVGNGAVYLSTPALTKFFVILVKPTNDGEFGFGYDSPMTPNDNAWDWAFFDGSPVDFDTLMFQLYDAINRARAAGVGFAIVRDSSL